nr:hypothetical protein [Tanacetum cinerariifolium]
MTGVGVLSRSALTGEGRGTGFPSRHALTCTEVSCSDRPLRLLLQSGHMDAASPSDALLVPASTGSSGNMKGASNSSGSPSK